MRRCAAAILTALVVSACGSGNVGQLPPQQTVDPAKNGVLQFAVGNATVNFNGRLLNVPSTSCYPGSLAGPPYYGINFVETFRQPNGLAAALYDVPKIVGPAGFVGDSDAVTKAATNTIFKAFQRSGGSGNQVPFLQDLGAFGFGFGAEAAGGGAPVFGVPTTPSFDFDLDQGLCVQAGYRGLNSVGGAPAWPYVPGGFPVGEGSGGAGLFNAFIGYPLGFLTYLSTSPIPAGDYTLSIDIPTGTAVENVSATATLKPAAPLPVFPVPSAMPDPAHPGGLIIDVDVPAGVTEAFVNLQNPVYSFANNYSVAVPTNVPGHVRVTLPSDLGAPLVNSSTPTRSIAAGDTVAVYAIGFDYDLFGASYPGNRSQRPAIGGSSGRADVTISDVTLVTVP